MVGHCLSGKTLILTGAFYLYLIILDQRGVFLT